MNKRQLIIITAAVISTTAIAGGTAALLSYFEGRKNSGDTQKPVKKVQEKPMEDQFKENIDEVKNEQAKTIEDEAVSLIESDPTKARKKFLEAEQAYKEAGNMSKVGEMRANALSAQAEIEAKKTSR